MSGSKNLTSGIRYDQFKRVQNDFKAFIPSRYVPANVHVNEQHKFVFLLIFARKSEMLRIIKKKKDEQNVR